MRVMFEFQENGQPVGCVMLEVEKGESQRSGIMRALEVAGPPLGKPEPGQEPRPRAISAQARVVDPKTDDLEMKLPIDTFLTPAAMREFGFQTGADELANMVAMATEVFTAMQKTADHKAGCNCGDCVFVAGLKNAAATCTCDNCKMARLPDINEKRRTYANN